MYHPFSVTETISISWSTLKRNFVTLVVYSFISLFVSELIDFFNNFLLIDNEKWSLLLTVFIQMIIQSYLALSFYKLILTLMDKEFYEFSFRDILPTIKMTFNCVLFAFLYTATIVFFLFINFLVERSIGSSALFEILELVILMYISLRSIFCVCFIVDDNSALFESLKQSFEITKDNFFKTLGIFIIIIAIMAIVLIPVILLINIFGLDKPEYAIVFKLSFYCWFLLTFPFVQVIIMVAYRKLVYSHLDVDDDITETV